MGILSKLLKKNLTPEEQERKSQEEKEWAEKCHNAGKRFGEKIGLGDKINAINEFGNKYPKTFFGIIFGLLFLSFGLNFLLSTSISVFRHEAENIEAISNIALPGVNKERSIIQKEAQKVAEDMKVIKSQIDSIISKKNLTHEDSVVVRDLLYKLNDLNEIIK